MAGLKAEQMGPAGETKAQWAFVWHMLALRVSTTTQNWIM
jgi:hypothetical protein